MAAAIAVVLLVLALGVHGGLILTLATVVAFALAGVAIVLLVVGVRRGSSPD
jgi:hypothetical protein